MEMNICDDVSEVNLRELSVETLEQLKSSLFRYHQESMK